MKKARPLMLLAAAAILLAGGHRSLVQPDGASSDAPHELTLAPGDQGLRAHIDPVTGQFTAPPPGVSRSLADPERRMLNRSDVGLQSRTLADGTVILDLEGRFMSLAVATLGTAEGVSVDCVQDSARAEACLTDQTEGRSEAGEHGRDVR